MFSYSDYIEEQVRAKTLAEAAAEKQRALAERDEVIASKMLKSGASVEFVHDITGLPMAAISNLRAQLQTAHSGMMGTA